MKTPFKRLVRYVGQGKDSWSFKTLEEAQEYIRKNKTPDYISVDGILYTMEEYDNSGRQILYANMRNKLTLEVTTQDRYKNGFGDAVLEQYPSSCWRNDISYAD